MGGFKRSGTFGIVGVIVVMAAVIGITMGSGQARPKLALGLIFGIVGAYVLVLFLLQSRDLDRAEAGTVPDEAEREAARAKLGDPTRSCRSRSADAAARPRPAARSARCRVEGGPEGLIVYRRSAKEGDWLCDLWLAERLAAALVGAAASRA